VQSLAFGGKGIAKLGDFVVFINGAVPGDVAKVIITKTKKRYAEARTIELVSASTDRVGPACSGFGNCGGCVWQNLDYCVQLDYKARQVRECLEHLGGLKDFELRPAVGMAHPWRYRNRVDFSIGIAGNEAVVGFRPPGRWDLVLPVTECHLISSEMESVRTTVENWLRDKGVPGWDPRTNTGFARHLLVRSARMGAELLVSLVTAPGELPDGLVRTLCSAHPSIVGVAHSINEGSAELSSGLDYSMLWGRSYLVERLAGVDLRISLNSFFQTNTLMAHVLYGLAAEEVLAAPRQGDALAIAGPSKPIVWDLYSGVGSIGLSLARHATRVLGIEAVPDAVAAARQNAELNGLENACFLEGDVRKVLREVAQGKCELPEGFETPDVVVVDPPRAGLHQRVVSRISELEVPRIVYISCNPSTMAPNVVQFQENGYRLTHVTPVDMFPHTPHVEAVGVLVRQ
jgi:23S rRNA (uracil1939-C5)-methyltransferase